MSDRVTVLRTLDEAERAMELLSVLDSAEASTARELTESSRFRRLVEALVRLWFYWWGGFIASLLAVSVCRLARAQGVPAWRILQDKQLLTISCIIAIGASFAPSGQRVRGIALGALALLILAVFATHR